MFELFEPCERAYLELLGHLFPTQTGPLAEVHLTQSRQDRGDSILELNEPGERLLHSSHRTGIDGIERITLEIFGHRARLFVSERRKLHIDPATEHEMIRRVHFAVA